MTIDISQFHATFLEEATEHLADLETGLLELEQSDAADMNAIFRAAHSIKGGAGTFGFDEIAEFTHVVESVLQKARDGELEITPEITTELLGSVDVIAELVNAAKENRDAQATDKERIMDALNGFLGAPSTATQPKTEQEQETQQADDAGSEQQIINISFKPERDFPRTGNEPLSIIRELHMLGDVSVTAHTEELPLLADLVPDELYIWWDFELVTDASNEEINDVFLFVEDDAEINISTIAGINSGTPEATAPSAETKTDVVEVTPLKEQRSGTERRQTPDRRNQPEKNPESVNIRVAIDKVDHLINLVGELVTTNAMVEQHSRDINIEENQQFGGAISQMSAHTRNLQEAIMAIRMMPIDFAFARFPRMVRDTAGKLGKKVNLESAGGQTELDKTVIEKISDPLTHLVRNAIDHGIELPAERVAAGKPEEGHLLLAAYYRGGSVIIEIRDDGKGLSREKILEKALEKNVVSNDAAETMPDDDVWQLIFESGFSTAEKVTDVSGRGVGMDVVRKNIQALGGTVHIESEQGKGTCFTVSLPLTLAIVDGMALKVGNETYIIPILNILESLRPNMEMVNTLQDGVEVINFRGDYVPLLRLHEAFPVETKDAVTDILEGIAVIAESEHNKIALFVDDLLGERQVVIKSVEDNYKQIEGISGATILGDGRVAFILDLPGIIKLANREGRYAKSSIKATESRKEIHQ